MLKFCEAWLKPDASDCAAFTSETRADGSVGLVATDWKALNKLFNWSDKPCVSAELPEVPLVEFKLRNSFNCVCAFCSALCCEFQ